MSDRSASLPRVRREWLAVCLAVVAVKALFLLLDATPRFFLWDSVTYLQGALGEGLPRDRSFLYSYLIRYSALATGTLGALTAVQTLAGVGSALLVFGLLRVWLGAGARLAGAAALLVAALPSQLFYERMMMAEAGGSVLWLGFVAAVLGYCRRGEARWLPAVALLGIASIAFRLNGTPTVLLLGGLLPLWFAAFRRAPEAALGGRRLLGQLALVLACTAALHVGYRHLVGRIAHTPPGYIGVEGVFRLGLVAPFVEQADFAGTGCPEDILQRFPLPLADPDTREGQLWRDDGLWAAMRAACPEAEHAADVVSARALHRRWTALPALALHTAAQYFDAREAAWRMNSDLGRHDLPLELIVPARARFGVEIGGIPWTDTPVLRLFEHSRWPLTLSFFGLPLLSLALLWAARRRRHAPAQALACIGLLSFATQFLLSHVICFRYLAPFPVLFTLHAAVLLAWARDARVPAPAGLAAAPVG